jgi:hypothetical protein
MSFHETPNSNFPAASAALMPPLFRSEELLPTHSKRSFFRCGIEKEMSGTTWSALALVSVHPALLDPFVVPLPSSSFRFLDVGPPTVSRGADCDCLRERTYVERALTRGSSV